MRAARIGIWLLPLLFCGCQPQPAEPAPAEPPTGIPAAAAWPAFDYPRSAAAGQQVYRLETAGSRLDVVVRRDGPLGRFGHDHAVSAQNLEGFLLLDSAGGASRADLRFRVADLAVDSAAARARYRLDTEPDAEDIEGTRNNLMDHVLDARQWPFVTVGLDDFTGGEEYYSARLAIFVNGSRFSSRSSFRLYTSDTGVLVEGSLVLRQTDLGLEPFSALGGGLRVADPLEIHFRLAGTSLTDPGSPGGG